MTYSSPSAQYRRAMSFNAGISIEKVIPSLPRDDIRALGLLNPLDLPLECLTSRFHRLLFPISKPVTKWCDRETIAAISRPDLVIIENSVRTHEPSDWKTVLRCFKLTWILDQLLSESQIGKCK